METKTILSSTDRTDLAIALIAEGLVRWLAAVDTSPDVRVYPSTAERKEGR